MTISLCAIGGWMWLDVAATPNAVVICVIIYNAAFGYSWGPIPWLYPPEVSRPHASISVALSWHLQIIPLTYRAKGVSISTATNWAFNWLVGQLTPYLQETLQWKLYPMFGGFCVCSFFLGKDCMVFKDDLVLTSSP
jgi:hypothetical protein